MKHRRDWTARTLALIALAAAVGGGSALAAVQYVITSTKQIKPSVLRTLHKPGRRGPQGVRGSQGPQGLQGPQGAAGANGAVGDYYTSIDPNSSVSLTDVSLAEAVAQPMLVKTIPAGQYALTATVTITASQLNASPGVEVLCLLKWGDVTQAKSYISAWDSNFGGGGGAGGTLAWTVSAAMTGQSTVTVGCADISGPGATTDVNSADVHASGAITALQVNSVS